MCTADAYLQSRVSLRTLEASGQASARKYSSFSLMRDRRITEWNTNKDAIFKYPRNLGWGPAFILFKPQLYTSFAL